MCLVRTPKKEGNVSYSITMRPAITSDLSAINEYAADEGMDAILSPENIHVALNSSEEIIGFIRLAFYEGICYVNPIVVYPTWRRYGVGRLLIEKAFDRWGELRLVSRGSSLAFYTALGFTPIAWDAIAPAIAADCKGCELFEECAPTPVCKK